MFEQMRNNTKTILWITTGAFVLLIFLAWGADFQVGGKKGGAAQGVIGTVNGVPITSQAFEQAVTQTRARYQEGGREVDDRTEVQIRNQTWEDLVQEVLLRQEVQKRGIGVTDEEVVQAVLNNPSPELMREPALQTNGQFDLAKYQAILRSPGFDTRGLEQQYRENLPLQKLQMIVVGSIAVSDQELFDTWRAQNEQVKVSYCMIPASKFNVDEGAIGQADLERYYQGHKSNYHLNATSALQYVFFPRRTTDQDSLNLIDQGRQVLSELKDGEDFSVLVDAYSEAPAALRGGENAAFIPVSQIPDPPVREAAIALAAGQNSDVILTPGGIHIIKVLDKKTDPATGDQVKIADVFMPMKPSPETINTIRDQASQFRTEVEKRSFGEVAAEMKVSVKDTGPFEEKGFVAGLGSAQELRDFAFRNPVGTVSSPIERPDGWYVAKVTDRRDAHVAELKEIQDRVRQEVADSLRLDQATTAAAALLDRARSGMPLAQVAAGDPRATFDTTDPFPRVGFAKGIGKDAKVIGTIFASPVGLIPQVIRGQNAVFVVQVEQKIEPDKDKFEAQKQQQRQMFMQRRQSQLMNDWMAELKKDAKIEDYRFGQYD